MMKKILKILDVLIVLSFIMVVYPTAIVSAVGEETTEKLFVVAIEGDVETLDPNFAAYATSNWSDLNLYDQFFEYGIDDTGKGYSVTNVSKMEGKAIESWEVAEDRMSVVLHVRKGVTFPLTGNPMTADDIIFWYKRGLNTDGGIHYNIEACDISNVTKIGDYDVLVEFSRPLYLFFYYGRDHSQGVIDSVEVMKHATADDPWGSNWLAKHYAGAGEYIVESWDQGVQMVWKANKDYWAGKAYFDKVILKVIPDSTRRAMLMKQGEVDAALGLSPDQIDAIRDDENVNVLSLPSRTESVVFLNNSIPPFDNKKVRQAVSYLVPYESILNDIYKGRALQAKSVIPILGTNCNPGFWPYEFNVDKAKELLAEAGVPDGFEFSLNVKQGEEVSRIIAVTLQGAFKKAGVKMNIREVTNAIWASEMATATAEATLWAVGYLMYVDDFGYALRYLKCNALYNRGRYCNPRVDELCEEFINTFDPVERQKLADVAQYIIINDAPMLWLANVPLEYPLNSNIEGFVLMQDSLLWLYPLRHRVE